MVATRRAAPSAGRSASAGGVVNKQTLTPWALAARVKRQGIPRVATA
jgi:hypothetical protein